MISSSIKAKTKTKKRASYQRRRHTVLGYAFMAPWIIGFIGLTAWPFIYTFYLSFFSVEHTVLGWSTSFVGITNYDIALLRNPYFVPNLIAFAIMQVTYAPTITVIAFILALLLNRGIRARGWFRALFFLPVIVMSGPVMHQLMDSGGLSSVGIDDMVLLNMVAQVSTPIAQVLIVLFENYSMVLWFTGIPIVLFISALQKIDNGILEAARIHSATSWQILWKITLPILKPIVLVSFILTVVQLASFTLNPVLPMITEAIHATTSGLGLASAYAWIYSIVVLGLIGIVYWLLKSPKDVVPKADVYLPSKTIVRKAGIKR